MIRHIIGRGRGRRQAPHPGDIQLRTAPVCPDQPRRARLHPTAHGPVVRHYVRADRGGGARGRARDRQHAHSIDHGSPPRARRAASGRRAAQSDSPDNLAGGADYRRRRSILGMAFMAHSSSAIVAEDIAGLRLGTNIPYQIPPAPLPVMLPCRPGYRPSGVGRAGGSLGGSARI